jgi:hypothetical protein
MLSLLGFGAFVLASWYPRENRAKVVIPNFVNKSIVIFTFGILAPECLPLSLRQHTRRTLWPAPYSKDVLSKVGLGAIVPEAVGQHK